MKQLQEEMVWPQLHQGRAGGVAKALIGGRDQTLELIIGEKPTDEGLHHPEGHLFIGQPRQRGDLGLGHYGHGFGHIQPTIACQTRHHRFAKGQNGGRAPCRDIAHLRLLNPTLPDTPQKCCCHHRPDGSQQEPCDGISPMVIGYSRSIHGHRRDPVTSWFTRDN